ncbi:MAG: FtsW/RodA/SpoVE family cell cycle protein, partial [Burkholderiales bacterium]
MINRPLASIGKHLDRQLLILVGIVFAVGTATLYSASGASLDRVAVQLVNALAALVVMWIAANTPLHYLSRIALPVYIAGMLLLVCVALFGQVVNGARRWLDLGFTRIQPSELMKIAVPLMLAWYFDRYEAVLRLRNFVMGAALLLVPVLLVARQPDLGTALVIFAAGFYVLFLAGLSWKILLGLGLFGAASLPMLWAYMHDYQKQRVLTLLDPTQDPLGAGYHTIQSAIALGSGGVLGKGWLNGT